jgi:hypothetical protein
MTCMLDSGQFLAGCIAVAALCGMVFGYVVGVATARVRP